VGAGLGDDLFHAGFSPPGFCFVCWGTAGNCGIQAAQTFRGPYDMSWYGRPQRSDWGTRPWPRVFRSAPVGFFYRWLMLGPGATLVALAARLVRAPRWSWETASRPGGCGDRGTVCARHSPACGRRQRNDMDAPLCSAYPRSAKRRRPRLPSCWGFRVPGKTLGKGFDPGGDKRQNSSGIHARRGGSQRPGLLCGKRKKGKKKEEKTERAVFDRHIDD